MRRDDQTAPPVLRVEGLCKSFKGHLSLGRTHALQGVSFEVRQGEIYGLLGPNGAGKTTTLKLILGLLRPDTGRVTIFGRPASEPASRRRIGFLPENPYFYDYLTAREFLDFYGRLQGIPGSGRAASIAALLELVGLAGVAHRPLRKFSKGMVQRVGMAQALLGDPEFVILDEPMSGLDPIGRREFRDIILSLRKSGRTVFFSSHILQDAEMICDRVGILKEGRLIREGDLDSLLDAGTGAFEVTVQGDPLPDSPGWRIVQTRGDETLLRVEGEEALGRLLRAVTSNGTRLVAVNPIRRSLEEAFLREIEGAPREPAADTVGARR